MKKLNTQRLNISHSSKLHTDINGTSMNQRGKKFQEKQQQNNSQSHSLTEVLVKPKLNSAAV